MLVRDQEVIQVITAYPEGRIRREFAGTCLNIGVLALKPAEDQIDAHAVHNVVEKLLESMRTQIDSHRELLVTNLVVVLFWVGFKEAATTGSAQLLDRAAPLTTAEVAGAGVAFGALATLWPFTLAYLRGRISDEQLGAAFTKVLGDAGVALAARLGVCPTYRPSPQVQ